MALIYITGATGAGKSAVKEKLALLGFDAYDEDSPGVGAAHSKQTGLPVSVPLVTNRTPEWFKQHEWRVLDNTLAELHRKAADHLVFLCGNSLPPDILTESFDKVIYLKIDEQTLRQRLTNREDNDYGKSEAELVIILERLRDMDNRYSKSKAIIIDAAKQLDKVVIDIVKTTATD